MALVSFNISGLPIYVNPAHVILLVEMEPSVTSVSLISSGTLQIALPIAQVAAALDAGA